MKILQLLALILMTHINVYGQFSQTVRGTVEDVDTKTHLIGATIVINGESALIDITDGQGKFKIEDVPIGRATISISYLGYEEFVMSNVVINSGKEVVLKAALTESAIQMEEITVVAQNERGQAQNEMAILSGQSISPEQTSRYAGGFNDPSRIVANFAGVATTQDGGNDILIRGNSPKYMQWRLEGMEITNPNHFGDQSAVGGSVSTLNNNMLDNSDFFTGAFSAEYGNVLSGIYDVKFRNGNNEKHEAVAGIGILGMDLTVEGPLKQNYGGSYLVNYRYSTAGLANDIGLLGDIEGIPTFQDASFKVILPAKKMGVFSFYGLGGKSAFEWENVKPHVWVTPGDAFQRPDLQEDYIKDAHLYNIGLNHTVSINKDSYLKTGFLYSAESIQDEISQRQYLLENGVANLDSLIDSKINFLNNLTKTTLQAATSYHYKINPRSKITMGLRWTRFAYDIDQSMLDSSRLRRIPLVDSKENIMTFRSYLNWKYRVSDKITLVAGLHNMNVLFNNKSTLESRLAINYDASQTLKFNLGYGEHSSMESVHNYFVKIEQADGSIGQPNLDLDLLKARHFVAGVENKFSSNLTTKIEIYYQQLYNLPVENNMNSNYSTINEGLDFNYVDLVNKGTGRNYGIEFTAQRFFENSFYFLVNASLYETKYTALDGIERDAKYNGNYIANVLFGKEFSRLGKNNNQSLSINVKGFYSGGRRVTPLLRDHQGQLTVDSDKNLFYDEAHPYSKRLNDFYQINLSASYKWNKRSSTHELFLNIDNLTNHRGQISEYYDVQETNSVGHVRQFGMFPNLMYRVYF